MDAVRGMRGKFDETYFEYDEEHFPMHNAEMHHFLAIPYTNPNSLKTR